MKKLILLLFVFVIQTNLYAWRYFPEGTRWTEIRLDTMKYDSWYSKIGDEWVPNYETLEYRVYGEYVDERFNDRYSCIYTNGPEWTDSLTLLIYWLRTPDDDWYGGITVAAFDDDGQLSWPCHGQMYPLSWEVGMIMRSLSINMAGITGFGDWMWDVYGTVEEIKEGNFGGVRPLKYSDVNGIRFIQGIGVASWNDGECIFGPIRPYEVLSHLGAVEDEERHYRSMLVHFERDGEVLYDVWPEKGVEINKTNFPDENFRNWVLSQPYGQDGVLTDEEIANVSMIDVYHKGIQSLKGIEFFTSLTWLRCYGNQLTTLDVSKNTSLSLLHCMNNRLTTLNVSNLRALENLCCQENQLTTLDVSGCAALTGLMCDDNQLTTLDVSGCTALTTISCNHNQLTTLDLSETTALTYLSCMQNQIKGEGMDAMVESLPTVNEGSLVVIRYQDEQNIMTKAQVAAARAKGWTPQRWEPYILWTDYEGVDDTAEPVTYTEGQMATIILPVAPDASKGKYYRLDRCEGNEVIFEQELQPRAHVPYIIVPSEDFSIDPSALDMAGLSNDTVSIEGLSFIGTYSREELNEQDGFYIHIIDTTPDCSFSPSGETGKGAVIGALRAYLLVHWDDPYNQGGTKVPPSEKLRIVLKDNPDGIEQMVNRKSSNSKCYDLQGRKLANPRKGIYIKDREKIVVN